MRNDRLAIGGSASGLRAGSDERIASDNLLPALQRPPGLDSSARGHFRPDTDLGLPSLRPRQADLLKVAPRRHADQLRSQVRGAWSSADFIALLQPNAPSAGVHGEQPRFPQHVGDIQDKKRRAEILTFMVDRMPAETLVGTRLTDISLLHAFMDAVRSLAPDQQVALLRKAVERFKGTLTSHDIVATYRYMRVLTAHLSAGDSGRVMSAFAPLVAHAGCDKALTPANNAKALQELEALYERGSVLHADQRDVVAKLFNVAQGSIPDATRQRVDALKSLLIRKHHAEPDEPTGSARPQPPRARPPAAEGPDAGTSDSIDLVGSSARPSLPLEVIEVVLSQLQREDVRAWAMASPNHYRFATERLNTERLLDQITRAKSPADSMAILTAVDTLCSTDSRAQVLLALVRRYPDLAPVDPNPVEPWQAPFMEAVRNLAPRSQVEVLREAARSVARGLISPLMVRAFNSMRDLSADLSPQHCAQVMSAFAPLLAEQFRDATLLPGEQTDLFALLEPLCENGSVVASDLESVHARLTDLVASGADLPQEIHALLDRLESDRNLKPSTRAAMAANLASCLNDSSLPNEHRSLLERLDRLTDNDAELLDDRAILSLIDLLRDRKVHHDPDRDKAVAIVERLADGAMAPRIFNHVVQSLGALLAHEEAFARPLGKQRQARLQAVQDKLLDRLQTPDTQDPAQAPS